MSNLEAPLSEYELLRQRNVERNHEFMRSIGLVVPVVPRFPKRTKTVTMKKERKTSSSSDESDNDEDWLPGSEDARAQKKMIKRFIPEFRSKRLHVNDTMPKKNCGIDKSKPMSETDDSAFDELGTIPDDVLLGQDEVRQGLPAKRVLSQPYATITRRYPKRAHDRCFREAEVPDDDHYLFCEECQDLHYGDCCPVHGPLAIVDDSTVPENVSVVSSLARTSLPDSLEIRKSTIPNSGFGVFSTTRIDKGVRFGPYRGKQVRLKDITDETDTCYMWEIMKDGKFSHFVDGADESCSNWMMFVNCSRSEDEQNLVAFQFRGDIYYRSYKTTAANTELLVWYGDKYAEELGITVTTNSDEKTKAPEDRPLCENCGRLFTCSRFLERHIKYRCQSSVRLVQSIKCPLCNKEAATPEDATKHLMTHATARPNQCPLCDKTLKGALTKHLRTHTGEKPFKCTHCHKAFNRSGPLTTHLRTHTGEKPFKCTHCNKAFNRSGHLTTHLRTHTGEKPFKCTHCHKAFNGSGDLTKHLRTHTGEKPFKCTHCHKAFNRSGDLTTHLRTHTGEKPFKCTHCDKAFNRSGHLTTHLRTHTGEKPFKCTHCDKAFNRSGPLTTHLRTHTGEKPFKCTHCDKAFNQSVHLTTHLRTHTGEKPFKCTHCDKAFNQSGPLTTHLRTHTGEKPFKCTHCDKAFNQSVHLTTHLRTHTGEKPFKCTHCHKSFNRSGDLTVHLRIHTGEKPFKCTYCDKAFNQSSNLITHLRNHR